MGGSTARSELNIYSPTVNDPPPRWLARIRARTMASIARPRQPLSRRRAGADSARDGQAQLAAHGEELLGDRVQDELLDLVLDLRAAHHDGLGRHHARGNLEIAAHDEAGAVRGGLDRAAPSDHVDLGRGL